MTGEGVSGDQEFKVPQDGYINIDYFWGGGTTFNTFDDEKVSLEEFDPEVKQPEDKTLVGWILENGEELEADDNGYICIEGPLTLRPKWANKCIVSFTGEGVSEVQNFIVPEGGYIEIDADGMAINGYYPNKESTYDWTWLSIETPEGKNHLSWTQEGGNPLPVDEEGYILVDENMVLYATWINSPTSVILDNTELKLEEGEEAVLTATIEPEDADNKNVTWTSSDPDVATVEDGTVKALKEGTTVITVTTEDGGKNADCTVTVKAKKEDAVKAVEEAINSMDPEDKDQVEAVRAAYDALTPEQKSLVGDDLLKKLEDAEKAIANQEAAEAVKNQISNMNPEDKAEVEAARAAYDALTPEQKELVDDAVLKKLEEAEKAIADQVAAEEAKKAAEAAKKAEEAKKAAEAAKKAEEAKKAAEAAKKAEEARKAEAALDRTNPTIENQEKAVKRIKNDGEPAGATFAPLSVKQGQVTKKSITVKWSKVSGASGYLVYGNRCGGKYPYKKLADTNKAKFTQKKLKKGTYYKYLVIAYKVMNGKKRVISSGKAIHVATTGGTVGNHKAVTVKKAKLSVKKGKTVKIKAKAVPKSAKLKVKKHRGLKYESSNTKIATVSGTGSVKGVGKGTCTVYVYAQNGLFKKVKITVK